MILVCGNNENGRSMQLILWRHADAEDNASSDFARNLTLKGRKQAAHMSAWLHSQLQGDIKRWCLLASPANRAQQTAAALGLPIITMEELGVNTSPTAMLAAASWPTNSQNVILVGHQPTIGMVVAKLINGSDGYMSVKKAAMWWFELNAANGKTQVQLKTMATPDTVL